MAILNRSIRNMVLAGIGAAALAHEESSDLLHHLVEKGEAIVTNSGIQNELLHHDPDDMKETETPVDESAWLDTLCRMTPDQLGVLKEAIHSVEWARNNNAGDENADEEEG
jgi:hypothetical protein